MADGRREVLFVTGTRADFGKLRDIMLAVQASTHLSARVVVTGMHLLRRYGYTVHEVERVGLRRLHLIPNQVEGEPTALVLANTVQALARLVHEERPDAVVVQGDRVEALAAALVGSLHNVRVIHIEGGELSGAIDDSVRHSISKHAHVHLVANDRARLRLEQMGEESHRIFVVGSPEIDILTSPDLPPLDAVRSRYDIPFDRYGVLVMHPVTNEAGATGALASSVVDAVLGSAGNWVIIDPNNDEGCADIRLQLDRCVGPRFARLPSMRFEHFVTLMRNADVVLGNSSSGVREAPVVGTRAVNVGTRQRGRTEALGVVNVAADAGVIGAAVESLVGLPRLGAFHGFGAPGARRRIIELFEGDELWGPSLYKEFVDRVVSG
ncbi:UDP-N-acetylglucosamine 2-epimerase (hydrolysing) [Actinokineospora cianjurensis]|uniref:UDP-N-acetylglucosamine 2-epimerase (Hydrolysing) n=1 Tax=Actinokineospora cianjurensis TaxID=585224 RepID=A0A421B6A3_9PSEU|nr:UDP-N-acetylglucosamine 2-epimerase (hydrolysing) [Actinokineospora cianjurensis]